MDVVDAVNNSNLILPAGDVKIGPNDYYIYSNSLVKNVKDINDLPLKTVGSKWVSVGDVGDAQDASQLQYNIVRIDGQKSAYIPIMKQGGDTNTIQVVDDVKTLVGKLFDLPKQLKTSIVFDQSLFVKQALSTVMHEGLIGLFLTSIMILIFLGSGRATFAVLLSIPISAMATIVVLNMLGSTINTMILGGLALAFSRVIDNSVISLENIYRHLELGEAPAVAAEQGGAEVNLAVLAATLVAVVDFFPVTFLFGVSKFLFSSLALAFCLSLLASFVVAMTVIPLFCAKFLRAIPHVHAEGATEQTATERGFNAWFNRGFNKCWICMSAWCGARCDGPALTVAALMGLFVLSLAIYPFLGRAFFPQTDAGQFTMNVKVPTGTRIETTNQYVAKIEDLIRHDVPPKDLKMILSNIGVVNDFSSLYTTNAGTYTATIQTALVEGHKGSSLDYMEKVKNDLAAKYPDVRAFFQSGSMVDAILNSGMPAPIDVQVNSRDLDLTYSTAQDLARRFQRLSGVGQVYIPQDMNYPAVRLNVDRVHAGELGLTQKDVVDNVITALNSNVMIAPNYWVDYATGNDYFLSVQYAEHGHGGHPQSRRSEADSAAGAQPERADYARHGGESPDTAFAYGDRSLPDSARSRHLRDALGRGLGQADHRDSEDHRRRQIAVENIRVNLRGMVEGMNSVVHELCAGLRHLVRAAGADPDRTVPVVHRSAADHAGHSHGLHRRPGDPAAHPHHPQRDVADGCPDADRHRRFQQSSDRGFCA